MKEKSGAVNLYRMILILGTIMFVISFIFILLTRFSYSDGSNELEMFFSTEFLIFAIGSCVMLLGLTVKKIPAKKFIEY